MPDHRPSARPRRSGAVGRAEQREASGATMPAPSALDGAGGDQRAGARRERGGGGRGGEDAEADDEHAAAAVAVAERGAGEQEDGERERVRVDGPLERLERRAEILADAGQRVGDDEVVEADHEDRQGGDGEGPAGERRDIAFLCE